MKKLLSIYFFVFASIVALAQGEANIWYFGQQAGVDFNGGAPVALTNGVLSTSEGCASISDKNGNLIFYTDGIRVYNRNHVQMTNGFGLTGDPSSAQSAIIVPKPGSSTWFYVFTVAAQGNPAGFGYSEVDMTLAGGLGDVVVATKNTPLFTPSTEKVTAVKHANGLYVWVIGHEMYNNRYRAYLVNCNGVGSAVISDVGQVEGWPGWGCLTASSDGLRLATAMRAPGFEVLDFNPSTGVVSNPIYLSNGGSSYGISFSPDNNLLYGLSIQGGALLQWNLQAGSPANIIASVVNLGVAGGTGNPYRGGAIQQGPDNKLYIPQYGTPFLIAINNPNVIGAGCNVQNNAVSLSGRNAVLGLPPFIMSYFDTIATVSFTGTCYGGTTVFTISSNTTFLDSVKWFFDDPSSGVNNTASTLSPSHTFTAAGTYNVQLIRYIDCVVDTTTQPIIILPPPVSTQNVSICPGSNFTLPGGSVVSSVGSYSDTLTTAQGCDSIVVTNITFLPVNATPLNVTICEGDSHVAGGQAQTTSGIYIDSLQNQYGCDSIVITNLTVTPRVFFNNNVSICPDDSYTLPNGGVVNTAGTYYDTLVASSTCDSVVITTLTILPVSASTIDTFICEGGSYLAGGQQQTIAGTYYDTLQNQYGCDSVITTNLTVVHPVYSNIDVSICSGETYFAGGQQQSTAGTYNDTLASAIGCDSVVITNLIVNPVHATDVSDSICQFDSYTLPSGNIVNATGIYVDTLQNVFGCDSIITTNLFVIPLDTVFEQVTICYDETYFAGGQNQNTDGIYYDIIPAAVGCDTVLSTELTVIQPVYTDVDSVVCLKEYYFENNEKFNGPYGFNDTLSSIETGCDSILIYNISVSEADSCNCESFYIPNAFSPNGDGLNEVHYIYGGCFEDFHFIIYNRWGDKVFESLNQRSGWNGSFNGTVLDPSVFVYYFKAVTITNQIVSQKGSLTLVR